MMTLRPLSARRLPACLVVMLAGVLLSGLLLPTPVAQAAKGPAAPQEEQSVPVKATKPKSMEHGDVEQRRNIPVVKPPSLIDVNAATAVTTNEHWSEPMEGFSVAVAEGQPSAAIKLGVAGDQGTRTIAGTGPVLSITADAGDSVRVAADVSIFGDAEGAQLADRVGLFVLSECVDSNDPTSCAGAAPLPTEKDPASSRMVATAPLVSSGVTFVAAAATASGMRGDFSASSLKASSAWSAGQQSGDFVWSYPLGTPPGIEGPEPDLAIAYSSSAVDGLTSATNNQASWVGEGFSLDVGFVERSYEPCRFVSGTPANVGDLCWRDDNLTMSFGGQSSVLVQDGSSERWRLQQDDGSRIERRRAAGTNGDNDGEYWVLTKKDGTRYYFGVNKRFDGDRRPTNSVSTVPVVGSRAGEPCHAGSYGASACRQAWRWNLDYVVDPHGNSMSYFYEQENNAYGFNKGSRDETYQRASVLKSIEYGTRVGQENAGSAPVKVDFSVAERCVSSGLFDCAVLNASTAAHWPDVPFDRICVSGCATKTSPTFFSRKRLASITTKVYDEGQSAHVPVSEWKLTQSFPSTGEVSSEPTPGDPTVRVMWLESIQQIGKYGEDVALPPVTFAGQLMDNRVDQIGDSIDRFSRFRVTGIDNGHGGTVAINYSLADCTYQSKPGAHALDSNDRRCFPVWFQPEWAAEPQLEFFHKYRVDSVVEADNTTGGLNTVTSYTYHDGAGWRFDESSAERDKYRTWNDWRGYSRVTTERGVGSNKTFEDALFMRGMDGDRTHGAARKSVTVTDPLGDAGPLRDSNELRGFERRSRTQLGAGGALVEATISTPWVSAPTASNQRHTARLVDVGVHETRTAVTGGIRTTRVSTAYDADGRPTSVHDAGDLGLTGDDRCTTMTYAENRGAWMLDYPSSEITLAGLCGAPPASDASVISALRTSYDGGAPGAAPSKGEVTKQESAAGLSGTTITYQTDTASTYDAYGRVRSVIDADGKTTSTEYAPATGFATTVTSTNALGQTESVTFDPAWGGPRTATDIAGGVTTARYDALGRITAVWTPGRSTSDPADVKYSYLVRGDGANAVVTERLNALSQYVKSVELFDGLMRPRGAQAPAAGADGGRLIRETHYDERGEVASERGPYYNSSDVDTAFLWAQENQIPSYTLYTRDRAGRVVGEELASFGAVKWGSSVTYGGDRVHETPLQGGTATTQVFDARGQLTKLLQYKAATPTGAADTTSYTYTPRGEIATVTTPSGSVWSRQYDVRGRLVSESDPDKGASSYGYDVMDRRVTATDARGLTLWTRYDALGRRTELRDDNAAGAKRAEWEYDTVRPGHLNRATRYSGGEQYTRLVDTFDAGGRPTKSTLMLPASEDELYREGGYVTRTTYNVDGSVKTLRLPDLVGIQPENLSYGYDALGNVTTFGGAGSIVAATALSPYGEVLQRNMGPNVGKSIYVAKEYEAATRRPTRMMLSLQGSATTYRQDLRYGYDQIGNVTKLNDVAAGDSAQTGAATWRQCFSYDYLRRMKAAWTSSGNACAAPTDTNLGSLNAYWDAYTYSASGNRMSAVNKKRSGTTTTSSSVTSTFPASTAARPHGATKTVSAGAVTRTETFSYDATGNLTDRSVGATTGQTLAWDREGRLASVTIKATGKKVSFVYDADGNRLLKRDETTGETTLYAGDGEAVLKGGTLKATRSYSLGGEPVAIRDSGGLKIVVADHHNTSLAAVDGSSLAVTKRRMRPFGELLTTTAWPDGRGFVNGTMDKSIGLTHLGAREYDAAGGRFISVDPIADFSDPQQLNAYSYSNNAPMSFTDPDGLRPHCGGGCGGDWNSPVAFAHQYNGTLNGKTRPGNRHYNGPRGRYPGLGSETRLISKSSADVRRKASRLGENSAATVRARAAHQQMIANMRAESVREYSWKEPFKTLVFDYEQCAASGSWIGCGLELAMIVPPLKSGKLAKAAEAADSIPNPSPVYKSNGAPDRSSPWYVSYRDANGNVHTVGNLDGVHAEARIQQIQPGAPMSKPFGWRTRNSAKGPEWLEGTVCANCQVFPRGIFPPGTRGAPGGPWGD